MRGQQIEVGQKFTRLTAKEKLADKLHNEEAWLCECECGKTTVATKSQLTGGRKKSCGCLRKETPANALDLAGQTFGKLKVIGRSGSNEKGSALWLCECKCGNTKKFTATVLRRGEATSCGCELESQIKNARNVLATEKSVDGVAVPLLTKKVRSDSGTGIKGVHRRVRKGKEYFEAYISVKGKRIWAPPRTNLAEAIADRKRLEQEYHKPYIDQLEGQDDG
jgi:hypothetical protein